MTDEKIWKTVTNAMVEEFELDPAKMAPQANIKDDLALDSLDVVDMVIVLETAFNFKIRDKAALAEITTLAEVVDFIKATMDLERTQAVGG